MPTNPQSQTLNVTKVTSNSITITWDRWAGCTANPDPITYKLLLTNNETPWPGNYWKVVKEGKGFYSYTFTGLKPETEYYFVVKAYDESGQVCQYPLVNGCMSAKTPAPDTEAPAAPVKKVTVTRTTGKTIAVKWEPATDNVTAAKDIRYQAWICEANNKDAHWHIDYEAKNISAHTFKGLKPDTLYGIYILALDEVGNKLRYPGEKSVIMPRTKTADTQAPTAENTVLSILEASADKIIIRWNPATDNETAAKDIRYEVYFKQDNTTDPWRVVKDAKNITTCTFPNLKNRTRYGFFIKAYDESGNVLKYPQEGYMTAVTDSANSKLVIQKGGTVYCDGIYGSKSTSHLKENLGSKFNRNYFEISFKYYTLATDKDGKQYDTIFTIDSLRRVFCLVMKDELLYATVNNNSSKPISLGFRFKPNKWQSFFITYDNGTLTVNGLVTRQIGKMNDPGSNIISSMNFGNGHAFKGYIKDLFVRSK